MNLDFVQLKRPEYTTNITFPEMKALIPANEYDIMETLETVCEVFAHDLADVLKHNNSNKREYVQVRQITMTLAKLQSRMSLTAIGNPFGKDHATVLHSIKTVKNLIDTDPAFREMCGHLFKGLVFPYIKN